MGEASAIISPCGLYRYRLERHLGDGPTIAVIMVNPSTADAEKDDATIRKLKGFGARNGWGRIIVGNLFAFRATDVRELATADWPQGPENMFDASRKRRLVNVRKTHCPKGHALSGFNVKIVKGTHRRCHRCSLDYQNRRRKGIRAQAALTRAREAFPEGEGG